MRALLSLAPVWRAELLGQLRVVRDDQVITRFRRQKEGMLFAYLAYFNRHPHPREALIELLWPECDPAAGRDRLSTSLSALRRQLEPPGIAAGSILQADRTTAGLNPEAVTTDVALFEAALDAAARARSRLERSQRLMEAMERYRGELLLGCFEEWVLTERQRLAEAYLQALGQLTQWWEQEGDRHRAIECARRMVAVDPLREEAHHGLIRLLEAAGQPEAARRQSQELERLLAEELGATPAPASRSLLTSLADEREEQQHAPGKGFLSHNEPAVLSLQRDTAPAAAPTGTITFLLAGLERSADGAELSEAEQAGVAASLRDSIRRECICRDGHVAREEDDVLLVAFHRVSDALGAAIASQRACAGGDADNNRAPESPGPVRFDRPRIVMHTGEAEFEAGRYQGPALDHAVRLVQAAHAGQILVSEPTAALIRAEAGPGNHPVELADLGVYRLRPGGAALERPQRLFQVNDPETSPRMFPPPGVAPFYPGRLPLQLTRFFGRANEIADLCRRLTSGETRLVTLTGPGGSGKTRLALAVAERLLELFRGRVPAGGCWFVPLAEVTDARRVGDAVAHALTLRRIPETEPLEQAVLTLSQQPSLLVLDNFEQLVAEGASVVRTLLERVPELTCLVTSRQRLGLSGEQEFVVHPLPTPHQPDSLDELVRSPSVQLFVDRAQAVRPDFQVTESNAGALIELCRRLEGLPLALELAAARSGILAPRQMLEHVGERFELLVSRQRDVPARHRTLRAAIDSSFQLLTPELQRFFTRLSVFRGGWTLEAAAAVCGGSGVQAFRRSGVQDGPAATPERLNARTPERLNAALDCLQQLRECSLIQVEERGGEVRYHLLETLREYAGEQLVASGELAAVRNQHRDWYLRLALQADAAARGPKQKAHLTQLAAEIDNLRAALAGCQETAEASPGGDAAEVGLRLADALYWLWIHYGYLTEGSQWLEHALVSGSGVPTSVRAHACFRAAHLAWHRGERGRSISFLQSARQGYEAVLTLARTAGDRSGIAAAVLALAEVTDTIGYSDAAWSYGVEARERMAELGDRVGLVRSLEVLSNVAPGRGDFRAGRSLLEERLALCRELGASDFLLHALGGMGHLERDEGDYDRARALYQESLRLRRKLGHQIAVAMSLEDLAVLAGRERQAERAIRLLGAAEAFCETLGARPPVADDADYERTVAEGRAALGEAAFAAAWAEGRVMSLAEAVALALEEPNRMPADRSDPG